MSQKMIQIELEKFQEALPGYRIISMTDLSRMNGYLYRLFGKADANLDELRRIFTLLNEFFTYYVISEPGPHRESKASLIKRLNTLLPSVD